MDVVRCSFLFCKMIGPLLFDLCRPRAIQRLPVFFSADRDIGCDQVSVIKNKGLFTKSPHGQSDGREK